MAPKKKRSTARGNVEKKNVAGSYKEALGLADIWKEGILGLKPMSTYLIDSFLG